MKWDCVLYTLFLRVKYTQLQFDSFRCFPDATSAWFKNSIYNALMQFMHCMVFFAICITCGDAYLAGFRVMSLKRQGETTDKHIKWHLVYN